MGYTANYLADFAETYTIDVEDHLPELLPEIHKLIGNSWEVLNDLIPKIKQPVFFFLDAHWALPTPTPKELDVIALHGIKPFIWIHDVRVPNQPHLGYDKYEDFTYNDEYIIPYLNKIYGNKRIIEYNSVATGKRRGCMMIRPRHQRLHRKFPAACSIVRPTFRQKSP